MRLVKALVPATFITSPVLIAAVLNASLDDNWFGPSDDRPHAELAVPHSDLPVAEFEAVKQERAAMGFPEVPVRMPSS